MSRRETRTHGLGLGQISLACVSLIFFGFLFASDRAETPSTQTPQDERVQTLKLQYPDPATQDVLLALQGANPAAFAQLEHISRQGQLTDPTRRALLLEALFGEFRTQAYALQYADAKGYSGIIGQFAQGLERLKANNSAWCEGPVMAEFLSQNDTDLVPSILAELSYPSPQYDWAMAFMTVLLNTAHQAQKTPIRHQPPGPYDETILQQAGLEFGTQNWGLAIQIAAFAQAEGQSYAQMREVISGIDVCELGLALHSVSDRLPEPVRARLWADLMPQLMLGNTPYALSRVMDYFFIG